MVKKKQTDLATSFRVRRQLNIKLLPLLVGILILCYILTGFRGWLVFIIGLAGVWLGALLWVVTLERNLSIERKIHLAWARVGDSVPEEIIISNKSPLPVLWVEIIDESTSLDDPFRLVTDVEAHSSRRRHPIHQFKRRGLYSLGPTTLKTGDPFGIYGLTLQNLQSSKILVTPPQLKLSRLRIPLGGWSGDKQPSRQSLERTNSSSGVREYTPGDSLRRVHWLASAHADHLIVRQFEAAASDDWWIFVDLDAIAQSGHGQDSTIELSIVLAASLVGRGIREHRRVGLAFAGPDLVWLEPHSAPSHHWKMLRALAMAEPGAWPLSQLLHLGLPARTASLILITPSINPVWVASLQKKYKAGKYMVLLIDPQDFGGQAGQDQLSSTLVRSGIPHARMPKALLEEAYTSFRQAGHKGLEGLAARQRFIERGRSSWKSLD